MTEDRKFLYIFLEQLAQECNQKFSSLNCGGCGAFARFIANELDARGIAYRFGLTRPNLYYRDDSTQYIELEDRLLSRHLKKFYLSASHVFIMIDKFHVNHDRRRATHRVDVRLNKYVKTNIEESYMDRHVWNDMFSKSQLPSMEKFIAKRFIECYGV